MPIEIKMPNLSQTTDEVKFLRWIVKVGDNIKKGDILCEVETDKVNTELESYADGIVLKLVAEPDQQIKNGSTVLVLGEKGENPDLNTITEKQNSNKENILLAEDKKIDHKVSEKILSKARTTNLVLRLANKNNVDISKVIGTGPGGIITKKDLEDYLNNR